MALEQDDTVFDQEDLDNDDDEEWFHDDGDDDIENDVMLDHVLADEEEEDEEVLNYVSPSTSSPPAAVPVAVAVSSAASVVTVAVPNGGGDVVALKTAATEADSDVKRQRLGRDAMAMAMQEEKKPPQLDESRRLFQRLWMDEDEIELLRGFLDYTTQRGGGNHLDTALFYDQIKSKLQLDFNKNQLVEKLRRLKKKYRNVVDKISSGKDFSFKSPHDQATFEISRKIWSNTGGKIGVEDGNLDDDDGNPNPDATPNFNNVELVKIDDQKSALRPRKRSRPRTTAAGGGVKFDDRNVVNDAFATTNDNNNNGNSSNSNVSVSGLIEETVRSCLPPLFKELLSNVMGAGLCGGRGIGGLAINAMPLSFGGREMVVDKKWRNQQILELEAYSKRLELVQDQIEAQLKELRSMGSS